MFKSLIQTLEKIKGRVTGPKPTGRNGKAPWLSHRPGSNYRYYSQLHLSLWQSMGVA